MQKILGIITVFHSCLSNQDSLKSRGFAWFWPDFTFVNLSIDTHIAFRRRYSAFQLVKQLVQIASMPSKQSASASITALESVQSHGAAATPAVRCPCLPQHSQCTPPLLSSSLRFGSIGKIRTMSTAQIRSAVYRQLVWAQATRRSKESSRPESNGMVKLLHPQSASPCLEIKFGSIRSNSF